MKKKRIKQKEQVHKGQLSSLKLIRDKHFRRRGSYSRIIKVKCASCGNLLFIYQKDGPGKLRRCYLNRILWPEKYRALNKKIKNEKELGSLTCQCGNVSGLASRHIFRSDGVTPDGRLAFELIKGKFKRDYPQKIK